MEDAVSNRRVFFCAECNNMLYPKEDRGGRRLLYACRNCEHQEPAIQHCVFRREILHLSSEQTLVTSDIASDPTLPRTERYCPNCNYKECAYFQSKSNSKDAKMTLYFICCNKSCGHRWTEFGD
ncbi:DNA-directed RNA polymerase II subunit RPB9-like protein [Paraphysoderma sedebokerense]|nr:DNA-directed RNA polymerase II subunit RPB9-like protein [Paraphysoderma sedebokerense]